MANQLFRTKPLSLLLAEEAGDHRLRRILGPVQLTALGVGAIIGTGIFILTGVAAHDRTGPALMLSFVLAGIACVFAALCYAEFASMVPVAGSAYTYAYATLGELFAWIIGWYLIITVYGTTNWHPFAPYGYTGVSFFGNTILGGHAAGGEPLGMFAGAAIIFFAYIGFDSVSVHSEEARAPAKDVPIGIIASLIICTILYIAVAAVLTGMVPYNKIDINAPVVEAFKRAGLTWMQYLVAFGAMTGITSVLLVMMLSQPRVMLALGRDGLVPNSFFGAVHPKWRTPWKSTILTGLFVASMAGLLPLGILAEMTSIGTLFAFVIVCGAVLVMRRTNPDAKRPFRAPLVPLVPILGILTCLLLMFSLPAENWYRLIIWLLIGLVIYFAYGRRHSVMARNTMHEIQTHGVSPAGEAVGDPDAPPSSPAAPIDSRINE